mmetsp:Transcript_21537/g.43401  ORF Transcript_21537/g.43401 Transcript_21537/m.43401 type:complete len:328 (+) Transcript_21537:64-1047(+)|eukprot:CAMPEP_0170246214 /NCGR_PEP_ID=MMETSP0116_2-20130129/22893_1 /TAXON_ID=400756 /ORGANISM="Durinskia baltica, Strain CSIRO CS-38" /LENGTH=327 /DNA_ID=CAMNT_0010497089 /DNA_START=48 /DNA_END=1031 /DNA_ORIENTATION=+
MDSRFGAHRLPFIFLVVLVLTPMLMLMPQNVTSFAPGNLPKRAPHPHQGVIPKVPFDTKPDVTLTQQDMLKIDEGELWKHSWESNGIGGGIAIRDIAAPRDMVFEQVAKLEEYVGKVPFLKALRVYDRKDKGEEIIEKAEYNLKIAPMVSYEYFVEHHINKHLGILHFFLDYDRKSDFDDMQGKWILENHPTKPGWTRAWYQIDMSLPKRMPKPIKALLTNQGLASAIEWVKKASEEQGLMKHGHDGHGGAAAHFTAISLRANWLVAIFLLVGGLAVSGFVAFRAVIFAPSGARQPSLETGATSTPSNRVVDPSGGLELKRAEPFLQ